MPFWSDVVRIAGVITAPVLIASGVGAPLGLTIGAVAATGGNFAADKIEQGQANNQADQSAGQQHSGVDAGIAQQQVDADARAREVNARLDAQLAQAALPGRVVNACRDGRMGEIPGLLQQMDRERFDELGLAPFAACNSAATQQQLQQILEDERRRRGIV